MKISVISKLAGLGIGSFAALCIGWSGLSYADEVTNYTTVSKASVKIQYHEQTASGVTEKRTFKTDDLVLELTDSSADKPPKNQQLVLLNDCNAPEEGGVLAVWDKDTDKLVADADYVCLAHEGRALKDDKKNTIYTPIDNYLGYKSLAKATGFDEIDFDAEIKLGKLKKKLDSSQPVCLKKFKTMAMAGYYDDDGDAPHFATGNKILRKTGSVKTNGGVKGILDSNIIWDMCTPDA